MRIVRFLRRTSSRPRVGLERDGFVYDVEALESALGAAVEVPGDAWDYHGRVVALGCAGLRELDAALLQGKRPEASRVDIGDDVALLAPCDSDRAAYVHVDASDAGAPLVRLGSARALAGPEALVDLPRDEPEPGIDVGLAIVVGDDLRDATTKEARHAIAGLSVLIDWSARQRERVARSHETIKGLHTQIGPALVAAASVPKPASMRVTASVAGAATDLGTLADLGLTPEDAVALASSHVDLCAGDVVGLGPLPRSRGLRVGYHDRVEVSIERIGTLRGAAVPRR